MALPAGYRQGIITAITVILGFSLVFVRFWGFELPGEWRPSAVVSAVLMVISILGQLVTLWRSLQIEDDEPASGGHRTRAVNGRSRRGEVPT